MWLKGSSCFSCSQTFPSLPLSSPALSVAPLFTERWEEEGRCGKSQGRSIPDRGSSKHKGPGASKIFLERRNREKVRHSQSKVTKESARQITTSALPSLACTPPARAPHWWDRTESQSKVCKHLKGWASEQPLRDRRRARAPHAGVAAPRLCQAAVRDKPGPVLLTPLFLNEVRNRDVK